MSLSPTAKTTARRNLGQRIERFINALEKAHREPNRLECEHVLTALAALVMDKEPDGEEVMHLAERAEAATPEEIAAAREPKEPVTAAHLRKQLDMIRADKAG